MSPETKDDIGIVHWSNPSLGVNKESQHSPLCHFFDDDVRIRVVVPGWNNVPTKEGWLVGYMDPICTSPRYDLIVLDGETGATGLHSSRFYLKK